MESHPLYSLSDFGDLKFAYLLRLRSSDSEPAASNAIDAGSGTETVSTSYGQEIAREDVTAFVPEDRDYFPIRIRINLDVDVVRVELAD